MSKTQLNTLSFEYNVAPTQRGSGGRADAQWDELRSVLDTMAQGALALHRWTKFTIPGRARSAGSIVYQFQRNTYPNATWVFTCSIEGDDILYVSRVPKKSGNETVKRTTVSA